MTIQTLISAFVNDYQFKVVLGLIVADFVLGVAAAFKLGTFNLQYVANFARNDVLSKVLPFFALHSFALVAGSAHIIIPAFDVNAASDAMFALVSAAMAGSLVSSLDDLIPGFNPSPVIGGRGNSTPPVPAPAP
jgi:hypothetical protein